ncbi:MAG TPA: hypothetical protein PKO33_13015, partial [Pyrinomonadaceae bacterium]|nr:hypothetical protein [Pyrinomonadaceae bacterium]
DEVAALLPGVDGYIAGLESAGFTARSYRLWFQMELAQPLLLAAMVLIAAVLGMLTLFAPAANDQGDMSSYSLYSTEADVLNKRSARDLSREQLLEVIYSGKKDQGKR